MTLLEVVIALSLFTVVAVSLMRITDTAVKYRQKISSKAKEIKHSRNFVQILRKDLKNIFFTEDYNSKMHIAFMEDKQNTQSADSSRTGQSRSAEVASQYEQTNIQPYMALKTVVTGGLAGQEDRLSLSAFSNTLLHLEDKTAEQNEAVYYLQPCKNQKKPEQQSSCLWRSKTFLVDDSPHESDQTMNQVLLERVKTFQLSYFNIFKNEWQKEWQTDPNQNKDLPGIIKILLEYENEKAQLIQRNITIPIYQTHLALMVAQ